MFASRIFGVSLCFIGLVTSDLFRFPFITPKFIAFAVALFSLSVLCFSRSTQLILPKIRNLVFFLVALLLFTVASAFVPVAAERITGLSHVFLGALLILIAAAFARAEKASPFLERFIEVQIPFIIFMFLALAYRAFFSHKSPAPFFHGYNIAGGFVAIAGLQLYFWGRENKVFWQRYLANLFLLLGFALLFYYKSRAALMGLSAALIYAGLGKDIFNLLPRKISASTKKILVAIATLVIVSGAYLIFSQKGFLSMQIRLSYWGNTLCLIKDYPFGIGPGAFEYVFSSYNGRCFPTQELSEALLVDHPHNMFLEFIAEIGILGFMAMIAAFALIYASFLKTAAKNSLEFKWLNASLLLILSNAVFEFPQGTAFSLFYLCLVLGVLFAAVKAVQPLPSSMKSLHLALSFLVLVIFSIKGASIILTVRADIKDNYLMACSLDRENWRACYRVASKYLQEKNLEKAKKLIDELAKNFEGHHPLLVIQGEYAEAVGDIQSACKYYRAYDDRFEKRSLMSKIIAEKCSNLGSGP